jgi:long-chain acyl-CoA synthetase
MFFNDQKAQTLPKANAVSLGLTIPALLDAAWDRHPNLQGVSQWTKAGWQSSSTSALKKAVEELALGLGNLGLEKGDRVAFLLHSNLDFCLADLGCLLAGLVDVPIDLTQTIEHIAFILKHSQAKALIVADLDLLYQIVPYLWDVPELQTVIVAEVPGTWLTERSQLLTPHPQQPEKPELAETACLHIPLFLCEAQGEHPCPLPPFPQCIQLLSLSEVRNQGREQISEARLRQLRTTLQASDLATIIYIASDSGQPKGVMLTHENLTAGVLAAFRGNGESGVGSREDGECRGGKEPAPWGSREEVALLFLPLTHIFARAFLYGHLYYGHRVYFSTPSRVVKHLQEVKPTIFITVPRLLEKVHSKIIEKGQRSRGLHKVIFAWAIALAQRYQVGKPPRGWYALQLKLADWLIFARWRAIFGGRLKALICGGAALREDLTHFFWAAQIPVLEGYGLTETSAFVSCNRSDYNGAGTVGVPIAGVNLKLAEDGEILVKSPYVMAGYYRDPEATRKVIDEAGWLHTGDLGEITAQGLLKIVGVKKSLFKLSTGKYVAAQLLEAQVKRSPLVAHAIAVGVNRKFCGMLIFPNWEALAEQAQRMGVGNRESGVGNRGNPRGCPNDWFKHPCILALYQAVVDEANCHLPYWSHVKRWQLIETTLSRENGLLTPTGQMQRSKVLAAFAREIEALYGEDIRQKGADLNRDRVTPPASCPTVPAPSCPVAAQSLMHY